MSERFAINCASDFLTLLGATHEKYEYMIYIPLNGVFLKGHQVYAHVKMADSVRSTLQYEILLCTKIEGSFGNGYQRGWYSFVEQADMKPFEVKFIDKNNPKYTFRICEIYDLIEKLKDKWFGDDDDN